MAVDRAGNLYIADMSVVRKVSPDGIIATTTTGSAIAIDNSGNLYVARDGNIRKIKSNG